MEGLSVESPFCFGLQARDATPKGGQSVPEIRHFQDDLFRAPFSKTWGRAPTGFVGRNSTAGFVMDLKSLRGGLLNETFEVI